MAAYPLPESRWRDSTGATHRVIGLAEQDGTGEALVICRAETSGKLSASLLRTWANDHKPIGETRGSHR